jgi:hypothetical protein
MLQQSICVHPVHLRFNFEFLGTFPSLIVVRKRA